MTTEPRYVDVTFNAATSQCGQFCHSECGMLTLARGSNTRGRCLHFGLLPSDETDGQTTRPIACKSREIDIDAE